MALKIVKADEIIEVNQIITVLYGAPGLGKSTLGFSSSSPIILDFDNGAYRASNRGDTVQVSSWIDIEMITPEDISEYDTVVIDTAGRALDFLSADIIRKNHKMGCSGALTLQGYGQLKGRFTGWLNSLKTLGKDVVLIAHASEEKNGDDVVERLDVQGGSKGELYKSADAMGRLTMINGQRVLVFSPSDAAFGKNPGCFPSLNVPEIATSPLFLGDKIGLIKKKLNELTGEQTLRKEKISSWMSKFDLLSTAEGFSKAIPEVNGETDNIKQVLKGELHKRAEAAGMCFNKEDGCYKCKVSD